MQLFIHGLALVLVHGLGMVLSVIRVIGTWGVIVIVVGNGHGDLSSNPRQYCLLFYIALISFGMVCIQVHPPLLVNSRVDCAPLVLVW